MVFLLDVRITVRGGFGMQIDEKPEAKGETAKLLAERRASNGDASPSDGPETNGVNARPSSAAVKTVALAPTADGADTTTSTAAADESQGEPSCGSE